MAARGVAVHGTCVPARQVIFAGMKAIKVIAFDADDTLWDNEPYFRTAEEKFGDLLTDYLPADALQRELFAVEMRNLPIYGYGIKAFMLSMVETIGRVSDNRAGLEVVNRALELGKEMLNHSVELLPGVRETLEAVSGRYRLVLATKGDLLDQERKLEKSGLGHYFHHIEVMSDKRVPNYRKLIGHLDCSPEHFLMVGNSVKSDILPVLELGGYAVHVPHHTTWVHEEAEAETGHPRFLEARRLTDLLTYLP